jgi:uncharacterized radical SAM superfamily Fe-S cluster-containing enzyme
MNEDDSAFGATSSSWTEMTTGLCPSCLRTVPASITEAAGQIWLKSLCARHGNYRSLLASDSLEYKRLRTYVPPRVSGCCGDGMECLQEGPPVCVLLLEITNACNLRCPTCYADARGHDFMQLEDVVRRLDGFFRAQNRLDVLMLSGGEPTIHPDFSQILETALRFPIGRVLVNTNGLRINQNTELLDTLHKHRDRIELYFSFASFRPSVHTRLYGLDLRKQKVAALERARDADIFVTLVPTVERGVNEEEIGDLYRFALSMDNITGLTYQPVMSAGRYQHEYHADERLTLTDVLQQLEIQTGGELRSTDFVGLPCSHPDCCALTYGFLNPERSKIIPLPRHLDVGRYLDLFSDRISFAGLLGSASRRVWSDIAHLRGRQTLKDLGVLFAKGGIREVIPLMRNRDEFGKRVFRIVVKPFMDAHTFDWNRVKQCCTKILNESGEAVSFCEYNVFHRGRKPRDMTIPLTVLSNAKRPSVKEREPIL